MQSHREIGGGARFLARCSERQIGNSLGMSRIIRERYGVKIKTSSKWIATSIALTSTLVSPLLFQEAQAASSNVTLNLMVGGSEFEKGQFAYNEVQAFEKAHPNIQVNIHYVNSNFNTAFSALASSHQLPDVFQPPGPMSLQEALGNHWVQPLNSRYYLHNPEFPKGSFQPGVTMENGKIYSFPRQFVGGDILEYNKTVMKEAGLNPSKPPTTWAQLMSMSEQVSKKLPGKYGLFLSLNNAFSWGITTAFASTLMPTMDGSGLDYRTGLYDTGSAAVRKAVQFIINLKQDGALDPSSVSGSLPQALGAFANNQVAFTITGLWGPEDQQLQYGGSANYGVAPIPVAQAGQKPHQLEPSTTTSFFISSETKHYQASMQLVEWLSSPQYYMAQMKQGMLLPPNAMVLLKHGYKFPTPQLQQEAEVYAKQSVYEPNIYASPGTAMAAQIEATFPPQTVLPWQILDGAVGGQDPNWQSQLERSAILSNQTLGKAIAQAEKAGAKVSLKNFQFPHWNGMTSYK